MENKKRLLVIQLGPLCDTIQTLMALRAIKHLYPGVELSLLVRDRFSDAAKRVDWLDQLYLLPTEEILNQDALKSLSDWIAPMLNQNWDMIVNWTFSEASSYLTALLSSGLKLGFSRRKDLALSCHDGWSQYVQSAVLKSDHPVHQNIHLTDILTTQLLTALQIHVGEPAQSGNAAVTSKNFFKLKIDDSDFNLDSNIFSKKWICFSFEPTFTECQLELITKVMSLIQKDNPDYHFFLVGDSRTQRFNLDLGLLFSKNEVDTSRVFSFLGRNDFDGIAYLLSHSQWLISICPNDTLTHLASVFGTRILTLLHGSPTLFENGPYGNGHYILFAEEEYGVKPELLYSTWSYANQEWAHRRNISFEIFCKHLEAETKGMAIEVYRSKIRTPGEGGGVYYEPLLQTPMTLVDWFSQVVGHIARHWYCGWTPALGVELFRSRITPNLIQQLRGLKESTHALIKILENAKRTSQVIEQKCTHLVTEKLMDIKTKEEMNILADELSELENLAFRLSNTHPPLKFICHLSKVLMHNLRGTTLSAMSHEMTLSYDQLKLGSEIINEWIDYTLKLAKPVAVRGADVIPLHPKTLNT